ncbi:ABC transporter permease [Alkanindiges sp. WGS2144]|uniref:ABC transporter permease n=1 Tax=Alkanindiges sp. WGS2144 TaxID=3366808 RepID=UPI00375391A3
MTIVQAFVFTLRTILTTRPIVSTLILAVLLYGFFYPAAYQSQVASQLPIVVVDQDQTALSRTMVGKINVLRSVQVIHQTSNFAEAEALLKRQQADAIFLIPPRLEASILRGEHSGLALYLSSAYLIRTREIGTGLADVIKATIAEQLSPVLQATRLEPTVNLYEYPLYNPMGGYGSYIFPAVAALIVQQTLLLGVSFLIVFLKQAGFVFNIKNLTGITLACSFIGILSCLYYFGFVYWYQDYPRDASLPALFIATPVFVLAVVSLSLWLGSLFDRPERAAQVLIFTSVPFFFLTGASWPLEAMPKWMAALAWLIPSTAGVRQFIQLNQMGASLTDISINLLILTMLALLFGSLAYKRLSHIHPEHKNH